MTSPLAAYDSVRPLHWRGDYLELLDQRKLPHRQEWVQCRSATDVAQAIHDLVVRGAPAIGIAAAYGVVLAAQEARRGDLALTVENLMPALDALKASRPTAVNLFQAVGHLERILVQKPSLPDLERAAESLQAKDLAANYAMAHIGAAYLARGSGVLTHCNTGSLATSGLGTALGVIRAAYSEKKLDRVFFSETRPWLQGARLTGWELMQDGIPAELIADSAGAYLMSLGKVQWLIVGADRVTANGDVANKIGTMQLAIAARYFGVKTMVVAPTTTIDMDVAQGARIPVEVRSGAELTAFRDMPTAAEGVKAWNPVFDIAPAELIDVLVTEKGAIEKPDLAKMAAFFA